MSEKLTPPIKKVARADGLKKGSANTTLTTPNHDNEGYHRGGQKETGSVFGK